jgi:hypothetical protein
MTMHDRWRFGYGKAAGTLRKMYHDMIYNSSKCCEYQAQHIIVKRSVCRSARASCMLDSRFNLIAQRDGPSFFRQVALQTGL